jgi:ElaB/YqjD/DUF883 family membrane-anchored ribosome-binding protein
MNQGNNMNTGTLTHHLRAIAHDADDLVKATAGEVSEKAREARNRLRAASDSARETCEHLQDKALAGARATDRVIRHHPYESIGIGFGLGLLIGVLVSRRKG